MALNMNNSMQTFNGMFLIRANPGILLFIFVLFTFQVTITVPFSTIPKLKKLCMGFEPGAAGWWAQTDLLSCCEQLLISKASYLHVKQIHLNILVANVSVNNSCFVYGND